MTHKFHRIVYLTVSFVALIALACTCGGLGAVPTATPEPPPTEPPIELPTDEPIPTKPPIGSGDTETETGVIEPSDTPFVYSTGAFSINFPESWKVTEYDHGTFATAPDGVAAIGVTFENAGQELDQDALELYAESYEATRYAVYPDYDVSAIEPQSDGSIGVFKTLDNQGAPFYVATYYWQHGTTLFAQDWWVALDQYDALSDGLLDVVNSITWDGSVAQDETPYFHRYTFSCPDGICEFNVPYGWWHVHSEEGGLFGDDFISPASDSRIQYFKFPANQSINEEQAHGLAELNIGILTNKDEIEITDEVPQNDGSIRLNWTSDSGMIGESFYEVHGATFYMWSWTANEDAYDLYNPLWLEIIETYKVP